MRTNVKAAPGGRFLVVLLFVVGAAVLADDSGTSAPLGTVAAKNDAAAQSAFLEAYPVFVHPRCLNCHPAGDTPLQGENSHPHGQNVQRGSDGQGKYALRCNQCHQPENVPGANMPPGVPNWHMPPAHMKMVFQGRSAGELCRQLKDPQQNGGHSVEAAIEHLETDRLVHWGWSPGEGRSTPPLSHAEFVRAMQAWVGNGAACPE
jgi:hypothetical protein